MKRNPYRSTISVYYYEVSRAFLEIGYLYYDFLNAYRKGPALRGKLFAIPELLTYAGL